MNENKKFFLDILKSYINGTVVEVINNVDWEEIKYLAKIHNVEMIVYIALNKTGKQLPILDDLKTRFLAAFTANTQQVYEANKLFELFEKNDIDYMPFKGVVVRDYYPDKEARTFGDIDIWIMETDRQKSDKILKKSGFIYDESSSLLKVYAYDKNNCHFEIHTKIIYHKLFNEYDYIKYFEKKVEQRKCINGHRYALKDEDHFIYLLVHLAKHFYNEGAGIRMFVDLIFAKKYYGDNLSFEYIFAECEKLRLNNFVNMVFGICNNLLGADFNCNPIADDKILKIASFVLKHGVFGFDNHNILDISFNRDMKPKYQVVFERILPDYEYMKENFPWFKKGRRYQLPYAWLRRFLWHLTNREKRNEIKSKFTVISNPGEDAVAHYEILQIMGLKE